MSLITPGEYTAKVVDYAITETKAGLPQATVRFSVVTPDGQRAITWFGSFKDGAIEYTIKALVNCGLKGNNPAGDLEIGREVSIVVDTKAGEDGKERNVVSWVNAIGIQKKMDPAEAKAKLERFSGAVMAFKQKNGVPEKKLAPSGPNHQDDEPPPWE